MGLPTLNAVVFLAITAISVGGLIAVLICYSLRHLEASKNAAARSFTRQLLLFGHGLVFQVSFSISFFGVASMEGATVSQLEGLRAPALAVTLLAAMACLLLVLSLAAEVIVPDSRRKIDLLQIFLYTGAVAAHVVMGIIFPPDHFRIRAWSYMVMCAVFVVASLITLILTVKNIQVLLEQRRNALPRRADLTASLRNMLAGLLLSLAITVGWLINFFRAPQQYAAYQSLLFVSTPPTDPSYTAIVKNPLLYMDVTSNTFLYPLIGVAASYPYLLSPGNLNWVRERWSRCRVATPKNTAQVTANIPSMKTATLNNAD